MNLPVRIDPEPSEEPVIAVDGAWGAPGLNLSHWPGNTTPEPFRHDLSTGCALRFAALPTSEQERWAEGCTAIQNNHYDTDGTCALFALARPDEARPRAERLLAAARAGDFFETPTEDAFRLDRIVTNLADPDRSPLDLGGADDVARWQRATEHALEALPAWLDGRYDGYESLYAPELERLEVDRADLARATRDELVHIDWAIHTAPAASDPTGRPFDPGRHALFGSDPCDRLLVVAPTGAGTTYRFLVSTRSWFDLVTRTALKRPDLATLAERLNELEGTKPTDGVAWRAQSSSGASPELWFGTEGHASFAEHAPVLRPSGLAPTTVRGAIADALRAALVLPD